MRWVLAAFALSCGCRAPARPAVEVAVTIEAIEAMLPDGVAVDWRFEPIPGKWGEMDRVSEDCFIIRINPAAEPAFQSWIAMHELAHVLDEGIGSRGGADHSATWGVYLARVWREAMGDE